VSVRNLYPESATVLGNSLPQQQEPLPQAPAQSWQYQENICLGPPSLWKAAPFLSSHPRDTRAAAWRCQHLPMAMEQIAASAGRVVFYHRGLRQEQPV